ncbi:brefeldin A-inhibited guanine nucleotide-exchange protein 3 [Hyalella azteca]|uniref:Brefeldin A-inhibited guanine nucleotide-exchange protein 3 n=1 Tax=Hyalella azteca TaxID=294128 RepID=A0A8B7NVJ2_HYAAZ|nr:brefeldin A-inhibited guanine nucleotide-exchange protein 3 [Hyalella azteca]
MLEQVLDDIVIEAQALRLPSVCQAAEAAKAVLSSRNDLLQLPTHELRLTCLTALQLSLQSHSTKLVALAVSGLNKVVRDKQFHSCTCESSPQEQLSSQFMVVTADILSHTVLTQTQVLKVWSAMWTVRSAGTAAVEAVVHMCGRCYSCSAATHLLHAAAVTAATAAITALVAHLYDEYSSGAEVSEASVFDRLLPLLQLLTRNINASAKSGSCSSAGEETVSGVYVLHCCSALFSALPAPPSSRSSTSGLVSAELVYSVGSVGEVRPVLQCLLQRLLQQSSLQHRITAIDALSQLVSSAGQLVVFAGPILRPDPAASDRSPDHLALFLTFIESLGECEVAEQPGHHARDSGAGQLMEAVVSAIERLLSSLEVLASGEELTSAVIQLVNDSWATLADADYKGPAVYHSNAGAAAPPTELSSREVSNDAAEVIGSKPVEGESSDCCPLEPGNTPPTEGCQRPSAEPPNTTGPECPSADPPSSEPLSADPPSADPPNTSDPDPPHESASDDDERSSGSCEPVPQATEDPEMQDGEGESENARHFVRALVELLPRLLTIRSTIEVDEALLAFSSRYCQGIFDESGSSSGHRIILNADGIYLATYASLCLNLQLITCGWYCSTRDPASLPVSQSRFIGEVHGSGVLVYLSTSWLQQLYRLVCADSFLQRAGYEPALHAHCALVRALTDAMCSSAADGRRGTQLLSDHRRLLQAAALPHQTQAALAGTKLCRRILSSCWDTVLGVLGSALRSLRTERRCGAVMLSPFRTMLRGGLVAAVGGSNAFSEEMLLARCLGALQASARLATLLGLQSKCGLVFSLLSSTCFPDDMYSVRGSDAGKHSLRLYRAHVLSLHVIMASGLELASHAPQCWCHIFRCCVYISELERLMFSESHAADATEGGRKSGVAGDLHASSSRMFDEAATQLNLHAVLGFLQELCAASRAQLFPQPHSQDHVPTRRVSHVLPWRRKKLQRERGGSCSGAPPPAGAEGGGGPWLLQRLAGALLRLVRSGRPVLHIIKAWGVVAPHLMEAACHRDRCVTKTAVATIHDVVNCLLASQTELPHFHFNEAVFKPFQNLLCLEMCDYEVQDQIVSSICEFVEGSAAEIRSGWRPLFAALKAVRPPPASPLHPHNIGAVGEIRLLRDIFDAFLATDNLQVFANAALDCILCLLNHVKGSGGGPECGEERVLPWGEVVAGDELCINALRYLHTTCAIIAAIITMPACPIFHAGRPMQLCGPEEGRVVDCFISLVDEELLARLVRQLPTSGAGGDLAGVREGTLWPREERVSLSAVCEACEGAASRGLLVWYSLLSGLAGTVIICQPRCQPHVLDTLFSLMRTLPQQPGLLFGLYCVNHVLLPLLQDWLRRPASVSSCKDASRSTDSVNPVPPSWEFAATFKQYVGLTTDLVVGYLNTYLTSPTDEHSGELERKGAVLMLQQTLVVLVECIAQSNELIARLGCSCFRHVVCSCGPLLPPQLWDILLAGLIRAVKVSLYPTLQLVSLFRRDSPNFYGDLGRVQVAARRDCTEAHTARLRHLANQVFLLESQHLESVASALYEGSDTEDRSFIFLLYPNLGPDETESLLVGDKYGSLNSGHDADFSPNSARKFSASELRCSDLLQEQMEPVRVPFRSVVIGLLANQVLLQTIGSVLIEGSCHIIPSLANVLMQGVEYKCMFDKTGKHHSSSASHNEHSAEDLPGLLRNLQPHHVRSLLSALDLSYSCAVQFDMRPGLKFLIQKVAMCDRAANLYRQAGASWTLRAVTLIHLVLDAHKKKLVTVDAVREVLKRQICDATDEAMQHGLHVKEYPNMSPSLTHNGCSGKKDFQRPTTLVDKNLEEYIRLLSGCFKDLCDVYLDLRANKEKREAEIDNVSDHEPLFFLSIKADEFCTEHRVNIDQWEKSLRQFDRKFLKGKIFHPEEAEGYEDLYASSSDMEDSEPGAPMMEVTTEPSNATGDDGRKTNTSAPETPVRNPFMLSDFVDSSASSKAGDASDSDDSSLPEFRNGDSGVASVTANGEEQVYRVTTRQEIGSIVDDYRRRKTVHAPPASAVRRNPFDPQPRGDAGPAVPPEIYKQRDDSLTKDSEAQCHVWTELLTSLFDLLSELSDSDLRVLLPLVFPSLQNLTAEATHPHLRQLIAQLLARLGSIYGFSPVS